MSNGDVKAPVVQLQLERLNALFDDIKELDKKEERVKVRLAPISHLLACHLCQGYLVNATAITECLHVFCRSCLIRHLQSCQECPVCGEKVMVMAEGALRYDRTLQDLVHLLVPRVLQTELKREHEFNTSLRRISLEGGLWHNRKVNLWKKEEAKDPQLRIHLINHLTRADKFLRVSVRMPLEQLICLIRAKFVSREGATIELHCNDFFLYSSSSTSPDDQLFSPKTTFFEIFLRIWYPNKKSQPMQIIYREVF